MFEGRRQRRLDEAAGTLLTGIGALAAAAALVVIVLSLVAVARGGWGGALTLLALPLLVPPLAIAALLVAVGRRVRLGEHRSWGAFCGWLAAGLAIPFALNGQWLHDSMHFNARYCSAADCTGTLLVGADRPQDVSGWTYLIAAVVMVGIAAAVACTVALAGSGKRLHAFVAVLLGTSVFAVSVSWSASNASRARAAAERACSHALAAERGLYTFEDSRAERSVPHQPECRDPLSVARHRDPRFGAP